MHISVDFETSTGHAIFQHQGKCHRLHGHNYLITIDLEGGINEGGMVADFGLVKREIVSDIMDAYDHKFLIERRDPRSGRLSAMPDDGVIVVDAPPTAENIVLWIASRVTEKLHSLGLAKVIMLTNVIVRETRDCYASLRG